MFAENKSGLEELCTQLYSGINSDLQQTRQRLRSAHQRGHYDVLPAHFHVSECENLLREWKMCGGTRNKLYDTLKEWDELEDIVVQHPKVSSLHIHLLFH